MTSKTRVCCQAQRGLTAIRPIGVNRESSLPESCTSGSRGMGKGCTWETQVFTTEAEGQRAASKPGQSGRSHRGSALLQTRRQRVTTGQTGEGGASSGVCGVVNCSFPRGSLQSIGLFQPCVCKSEANESICKEKTCDNSFVPELGPRSPLKLVCDLLSSKESKNLRACHFLSPRV